MQVRALKSFAGKYGHIRVGQLFNSEPHYAEQLKRNGLIEYVDEPPAPSLNRAVPQAPRRSSALPPRLQGGNAGKGGATGNTARAPAGGKARTSSSLRQDLASRKKTAKPSESGGKKTEEPGTP